MKRKGLLIGIGCILIAALLAGFIWWYLPTTFLSDVSSTEVARIEVFNGTNGHRFAIEDPDDVAYIVNKIQDVKMRKEEYSHVDGFVYSLSFYDAAGTCIEGFILNGDTIRDGAIKYETVYETDDDPLCFCYIKALEEAQRNSPTQ